MKKLSVNKLIEFRKKSERGKKTFVENIKSTKISPPAESGGDYWVSSISAICNSYREDDLSIADEKITELQEKIKDTKRTQSKNMYQKNIENLQNYKAMDLKKIRPTQKLSFLKRSTGNPILTIRGLQVEAKPSLIFTFGNKDEEKVGAIWFTSKINGYSIEEVGMFSEMLYRFLRHNYSNKYHLIAKCCIAIDLISGNTIDYSKIEDGSVYALLNSTLDQLNRFM